MTGSDLDRIVDKLISLIEKNIVAWDRVYNLLDRLKDQNLIFSNNSKDLIELLEKKLEADEQFSKWLKSVTTWLGFMAAIITTGAIILKIFIK